jgi:hypothetical protein
MSADKPQKISIGFHGGQILSARVSREGYERLRAALGSGGWHDLQTEEGTIVLDLGRIDYVLVDLDEHRVGF